MRKRLLMGGLVAALVLQNGCAHLTMLRTEELRQVQTHVDSLNTQLSSMQKQMLEEQRLQSEMIRLMRADQQVRFGELQRQVTTLSGNISESQQRLNKIDEKTQAIKQRWEEKAMADSLTKAQRETEIENLFEIAYGDFMAGRYDVALNGFKDLILQHPKSNRAAEAAYWTAETYYVQKLYSEAEKAYMQYIKDHAEGDKICAALYKLGLVYEAQKKPQSRTMVWKNLIKRCPDSEETAAAEERMQTVAE
ncbi:MAG: tetratricopeptide repeat protein [Fibrobacterota bacterium]